MATGISFKVMPGMAICYQEALDDELSKDQKKMTEMTAIRVKIVAKDVILKNSAASAQAIKGQAVKGQAVKGQAIKEDTNVLSDFLDEVFPQ